jgi:uncharacterized membrane protein YkvA (DUF1232 family)
MEEPGNEMTARRRRRRMPGANLNRMLAMAAFLPAASRSAVYVRLVWSLLTDDRVPASRKALLGGALVYFALPFDIVPDDVPILGLLDDLVVVVLGVDLFFDGIPEGILDEKLLDLGVDRAAFDRDLGQIRRLTPHPVRRLARRIPPAIDVVADAARASRLGPRVRDWINKEGSFA